MPVGRTSSSKNETAMLMDAIESLKSLHQKSRPRNSNLEGCRFPSSDNMNARTNTFNRSASNTPDTRVSFDASEHRRKIRELTIALEAQAMVETKRFALVSPFTKTSIETPRTANVSPKITRVSLEGLKSHPSPKSEEAAAAPSPKSSVQVNNPENDSESHESEDLEEQMKKIGNLTRELDAQLNAAMQAQAFYKKNPYATRVQAKKVVAEKTNETVVPGPTPDSDKKLLPVIDVEKEPCKEKPEVTPVKTLSTELETVDANSVQRRQSHVSVECQSHQENELHAVVNKEDFEFEDTDFEAPLSPNAYFVKYGVKSPRAHMGGQKVSPELKPSELKKAIIKNASILSEKSKDAKNDVEEKSNGTLVMFKKLLAWDISSSSSQDESQADVAEGRVYNDTFDDSSYNGSEERSDLDTKYSTSFETDAGDGRDKRWSRGAHYVQGGRSESFESEGSVSYTTTTTGGRTDGSGSEIEYQSSYTTSYSYDTASTCTTVLGRKGFPLM